MAAFEPAIKNTIRWEDATLSGKVTWDAGGLTKWGLAKRYNPEVSADLTLEQAIEIYKRKYWIPNLTNLMSQELANKVFDMIVNPGLHEGVVILQCALNNCGAMLKEDGILGSGTVAVANSLSPLPVIEIMRKRLAQYYEAVIEKEPWKGKYRAGWLRRAAS